MILQRKPRGARAPTPDSHCAAYKSYAADSRAVVVDLPIARTVLRTCLSERINQSLSCSSCQARTMTCRDSDTRSCEGWETWDYCGIDVDRLGVRAVHYARKAGASAKTTEALKAMLDSKVGRKIASLTQKQLLTELINDAYKPKMHKIYSQFMRGAKVDFALNIRKSPFELKKIEKEDADLYKQLNKSMADAAKISPLNDNIEEVLKTFYSFNTPKIMRQRAEEHGVAEVTWLDLTDEHGSHIGIASGTAEAASNAETTMTQLVQGYTIRAQVRALCKQQGFRIDRTEHVANSLGHLAAVVDQLNSLDHPLKIALFAGRRSSDRAYLLLQTWFCAHNLNNYIGSSSIFAFSYLSRILQEEEGVHKPEDRIAQMGRLIGTHAHEVMSIVQHLMSHYDEEAGGPDGPVQVCSLLAHLLFLRANGGTEYATALADTFGTRAFVEAALVTEVPLEFTQDVRELYPNDRQIEPGAVMFDVFKTWRLDSGDYTTVAELVVSAWEQRCHQLDQGQGAGGQAIPQQRPALMHSNLKDVEHVKQVASLPERIRPTVLAFGGVADGFVPFDVQLKDGKPAHEIISDGTSSRGKAAQANAESCKSADGKLSDGYQSRPLGQQGRSSSDDGEAGSQEVELQLASIVMKAVQARHPQHPSDQDCAGKHGDDVDLVKAQVDPRLPPEAQNRFKKRLADLFSTSKVDGKRASSVLARAYHDVTRRQILN